MPGDKYFHVIDCDLCDEEDVIVALVIGKQNCDQTHFRSKMNMMEINRLDLESINDAIKVLDNTRDALFRRKVKLEDIKEEKYRAMVMGYEKIAKEVGVLSERM